ncbi:MAG TPA: hypothetical protein VF160_16455 [Candidatus Dormibacteraeota bacterium]
MLPLLALGHGTPAYADSALVVDTPVVSQPYTNPCNGDVPLMSGMHHSVIHYFIDSSGGMHLTTLDSYPDLKSDAPALPSGSSYVVNQIDTFTLNTIVGGSTGNNQFSMDFKDRFNVISQGPAPDFHHFFTIHLTIDANGVPTATHTDEDDNTCTG